MSRRLALIIGNSEFEDRNLAQLVTPDADVNALAEVLHSPGIGEFDEVVTLVNQPSTTVRRAISSFFVGRERNDLLLLYFSGHGIRDDRGQLFLAVKDTEHNLLRGTAIPAGYITEEMDNSRSRRQVLILDCCHSGAFSHGMKGAPGISVGTAAAFEGIGSGRVVLTATDSTQYAWEGDQLIGQAENSVFTHYLIQGLRTGEADADGDGRVTLDELYNYVYEQVVDKSPLQTPGKWSYRQQGEIVIAKNPQPVVKPAELPADLQQTVSDPRSWVREGAVQELDRILRSNNPRMVAAAYEALQSMTDDDSRRVASAAAVSLASYTPSQGAPENARVEAPAMQSKSAAVEPQPVEHREVYWAQAVSLPESDAATSEKASSAPSILLTVIPSKLSWSPVVMIIVSFALAQGMGWVMSEGFGWSGNAYSLLWVVIDAIEGLIIGLALARLEPSITWKQILIIILGWVIGSTLGGAISQELSGTSYSGLTGAIHGAVGGLATAFALRMIDTSIRWPEILLITLGWTIGWSIVQRYGPIMYNDLDGAIGDTIVLWIIPGAITGAVAAGIGSLVMVWQLVRRRSSPASPV
jgi:hypothetical protein